MIELNGKNIAEKIRRDGYLCNLLEQVMRYWCAVTHSRNCFLPEELLERWGACCGAIEADGALLDVLRGIFPGSDIAVLAVPGMGFQCIVVDGAPKGLLPVEYGDNPFRIVLNQRTVAVHGTDVQDLGVLMSKGRGGLQVGGSGAEMMHHLRRGRYCIHGS